MPSRRSSRSSWWTDWALRQVGTRRVSRVSPLNRNRKRGDEGMRYERVGAGAQRFCGATCARASTGRERRHPPRLAPRLSATRRGSPSGKSLIGRGYVRSLRPFPPSPRKRLYYEFFRGRGAGCVAQVCRSPESLPSPKGPGSTFLDGGKARLERGRVPRPFWMTRAHSRAWG